MCPGVVSGMDVVRTNIRKINGSVEIESEQGKGSQIIIKLPLTIAIIQALMVEVERVDLRNPVEYRSLKRCRIYERTSRPSMGEKCCICGIVCCR